MCFSELDDRCSFSHEYFMLQRRFETKFLLVLTLFKELHNYVYICPIKECMHWMKSDMEVLTDKHYLSPSTTRAKAPQCSFWIKKFILWLHLSHLKEDYFSYTLCFWWPLKLAPCKLFSGAYSRLPYNPCQTALAGEHFFGWTGGQQQEREGRRDE